MKHLLIAALLGSACACLASSPTAVFAITSNELQAPVCDMAESLASLAMEYRLSGKSYTEAIQEQTAFMNRGKWKSRDYDILSFLRRIGSELIDAAYTAELPKNMTTVDQVIFFQRQWTKEQTKWCR